MDNMKILLALLFISLLASQINMNMDENDDWLLHARISTPYGYNLSWSNFSYEKKAEGIREEFLKMIERANISLPFSIEGKVIAIPYEKGSQKMLRILNFNGIKWKNAVPTPQNIEIRIRGNVTEAKLLDFMRNWGKALFHG